MESKSNMNSSYLEKENDDLLIPDECSEDQAADETLKRRISSHPLYGLLVEAHMDCLKVSSIGDVDKNQSVLKQKLPCNKTNPSTFSQPELDRFMEAYCFALSKLKEAMEEPQQETVAFINSMHLQLQELKRSAHSRSTAEHSTTSSGQRNDAD